MTILRTHPLKQFTGMLALLPWLLLSTWLLSGCGSKPVRTDHGAIPRAQVVQTAHDMLGAPYRYGGSSPRGFDCSGLAQFSYARAGVSIPRTAEEQFQAALAPTDDRFEPGDLLFFRLSGRRISHVGIYVGDGAFIHAPRPGQSVRKESLSDPYWSRRFAGGGRYF